MYDIYVGNYPTHYTEDDVMNLFKDFKDIALQRCFKKKQKSFCFFTCFTESQAIDVVRKMNKLVVDGRSLVVRAQDPDLQYVVENALEKADTSSLHKHSDETRQKNTFQEQGQKTSKKLRPLDDLYEKFLSDCGLAVNTRSKEYQKHSKALSVFENNVKKTKTSRLRKHSDETRTKSTLQPQVQKTGNTTETASSQSHSEASDSFRRGIVDRLKFKRSAFCRFENPAFEIYFNRILNVADNSQEDEDTDVPEDDFPEDTDWIAEMFSSMASANVSSTASANVSSTASANVSSTASANVSSTASASNSLMNVDIQDILGQENREFNYVCVSNFTLRTSVQDLFELFDDYKPVKIVMLCNTPREDGRPTQALVCFSNDDNASDAICNLNNTLYRGSVLNVYDITHISSLQDFINTGRMDCA